MKPTLSNKLAFVSLLAATIISLTNCSSGPVAEWEKKNEELIKQHELTKRELSGLPENNIESNIALGQVQSIDTLKNVELHPGVTAKIFWGTGNMVSLLNWHPMHKFRKKH